MFVFFTVPRKFDLPLVFVWIFCLGIPSALRLDILVNQVRAPEGERLLPWKTIYFF